MTRRRRLTIKAAAVFLVGVLLILVGGGGLASIPDYDLGFWGGVTAAGSIMAILAGICLATAGIIGVLIGLLDE